MRSFIIILNLSVLFSCKDNRPILPHTNLDVEHFDSLLNLDSILETSEKVYVFPFPDRFEEEYFELSGTLDEYQFENEMWFIGVDVRKDERIVFVDNKYSEISERWEYYPNERLKHYRLYITSNQIPVGEWKYYNEDGGLDSFVDMNEIYPFSYFEAVEIAKQNNFPEPLVNLVSKNEETYWEITDYSADTNQFVKYSDILQISTLTGKAKLVEGTKQFIIICYDKNS